MEDAEAPRPEADLVSPVRTVTAEGRGPFLLVVDHASNRIPLKYGDLGLTPSDRIRHIAWDPGALAVSLRLSALLDAPVVHSTVSRLVVDCNRDVDAPDLIPAVSETTLIPGNAAVDAEHRARRIAHAHAPFHAAIERLLSSRTAAGLETILVCMHSFTPIYRGVSRPWPIGLIHPRIQRFTMALRDALAEEPGTAPIGWNEPYSALNGVTYTLEHHGDGRGLDATMIEIRHDEILEPAGVALWADRLARCLMAARATLHTTAARPQHRVGERSHG